MVGNGIDYAECGIMKRLIFSLPQISINTKSLCGVWDYETINFQFTTNFD